MRRSFHKRNQAWADAHQATKDTIRPPNQPKWTISIWASHLRFRTLAVKKRLPRKVPPKRAAKVRPHLYLRKTLTTTPRAEVAFTPEWTLNTLSRTSHTTPTLTCSIESNLKSRYIRKKPTSAPSQSSPCVNNAASLMRCKISTIALWIVVARHSTER